MYFEAFFCTLPVSETISCALTVPIPNKLDDINNPVTKLKQNNFTFLIINLNPFSNSYLI